MSPRWETAVGKKKAGDNDGTLRGAAAERNRSGWGMGDQEEPFLPWAFRKAAVKARFRSHTNHWNSLLGGAASLGKWTEGSEATALRVFKFHTGRQKG